MSAISVNIFKNSQFQFFLLSALTLFLFKVFFGNSDSITLIVILDLLIFLTIIFLVLSIYNYFYKKDFAPLSFIMNVGIMNAFIFFIISFAALIMSVLFDNVNERLNNPGLVYNFVSVLYILLIISFIAYVLLALRHFHFFGQSKNLKVYFNTMLAFIFLASVSAHFSDSKEFSFISDTFFILSVLLILFNSVKISWIAFLVKKEKVYLLILSIVITVLFIVNFSSNTGTNIHSQMLGTFSPALKQLASITMLYGAIYFTMLFFTTLFHLPTAEAYDRKAEEVSSLQYFSKLITQVLDFNDLAETVTDITLRVSHADASWIIWKNKDDDEFISIANKNIGIVDSGIINKFILSKSGWQTSGDTKFYNLNKNGRNIKTEKNINRIAVSPLKARGEIKGILVAARIEDRDFNDEDKKAITTFSEYASVSIENSRLLEESIEKERLEKELDVAREIQRKILPEKNPDYKGLEISSVFIPAFEVGGDYYDFFPISETKLGFVIADVSGKGISAAFIMAEVKGIFESLSKTIEQPKEILIKANQILINTLDSKTFVSAAYGLIDLNKEKLYLARAGHCPVLLLRGESVEQIKPLGLGLGLSDTDYFEHTLDEMNVDLIENDTIVLFTDGITEAKNDSLDDFGEEYFTELLVENNEISAHELASRVIKEVTLFSKDHSQYDDITLVILKWKSRRSDEEGRDKQQFNNNGEKEWQNSAPQL